MILMTRLKNAIKKEIPNAEFKLRNININGVKKGCSGFITNEGVTVYVNTEEPALTNLGLMYRYARNDSDYQGLRNRWVNTGEKDYVLNVIEALKKPLCQIRELNNDKEKRL